MSAQREALNNIEFNYVMSEVRDDMRKLEILTKRRVQFLTVGFDEPYDWPIATVTIDNKAERIWYDFTEPKKTYWCEDMGISGSIRELAKNLQ